ncbi:peptidase [Aquimarina sp. MMG015]|uniref:M57 family metalloprotease n=1 Tax=Aquimarina TaxID=290174 RepID=UPI0004195953|nr:MULTISPECIES: M57 family metalloprotease [Aquimarina]AXT55076.1 peptidase [Aquimarina sp. AD1]MBQ4802034.1 peptidase [Aquimarina sp. MMG015]RKN25533.1 peptidase [Aquimarina sp. AD1]
MKKITLLMLCLMVLITNFSCQKKEINEEIQETHKKPTKEQLTKLFNMGVNIDDVTIQKITTLDGKTRTYLISGDITIPIDKLTSYSDLKSLNGDNKQYRDTNLVSPNYRDIDILGYTGGNFALTSKMQTALRWAVNNYNALSNSLNFNLTFGTDFNNADMVVYKINVASGGGNAGFPNTLGEPYKWVRINSGTDAFTTNVNEHVIGHEIGHCIGLRHQDWYNRQSCGYSGPLPAEPPAIWIPGTPTSAYADSIMQACFGTTEDGEFTDTDKTALNILY